METHLSASLVLHEGQIVLGEYDLHIGKLGQAVLTELRVFELHDLDAQGGKQMRDLPSRLWRVEQPRIGGLQMPPAWIEAGLPVVEVNRAGPTREIGPLLLVVEGGAEDEQMELTVVGQSSDEIAEAHTAAMGQQVVLPAGLRSQFGLQTLPGVHNVDGFYYALLEKK